MKTPCWLLAFGLSCFLTGAVAAGNVQKCIAPDGSVTFTDTSCPTEDAAQDAADPVEQRIGDAQSAPAVAKASIAASVADRLGY